MINEYNVLKSINELIRDEFTNLKYVEILSPHRKLDKKYFMKKDEDLYNKGQTNIFPSIYSFAGNNIDEINGLKRGSENLLLVKNDIQINLLILCGKVKDYLTIPEQVKDFLLSYKTGGDFYIPITDFDTGGSDFNCYVSSDIYISPYSEANGSKLIDFEFLKLVKEMVFDITIFKEN